MFFFVSLKHSKHPLETNSILGHLSFTLASLRLPLSSSLSLSLWISSSTCSVTKKQCKEQRKIKQPLVLVSHLLCRESFNLSDKKVVVANV